MTKGWIEEPVAHKPNYNWHGSQLNLQGHSPKTIHTCPTPGAIYDARCGLDEKVAAKGYLGALIGS